MTLPPNASLNTQLKFRWETRVSGLEQAWADCLGNQNALGSFALQKAIEASDLEEVQHHYLVAENDSGVVCLLPCFAFRVSLVSVASPALQNFVASVRRILPSFLMVRIFVIGSAISNYGDLLGFKDFHNPQLWSDDRILEVFSEARKKATTLGISILLLKELEDSIRTRLQPVLNEQFFFADSLPTTYLPIMESERGGYMASIRSKYRTKIKKRKTIGREKGLSWKIVAVKYADSEQVYSLYKQVLNNSEFVFERVNRSFFEKVSEVFPDNAFYILGYIQDGEEERLISTELVLSDGDAMRLVYSGFDYSVKRDSDLYFNVFYAAIEQVEKLGLKGLHLGQTAYEVKAELGAQCVNLSVAACHLNPLIHRILMRFKSLLFPIVSFPEREVFSVPPPKPKSGNPNRIDLPDIQDAPLIKDDSALQNNTLH